MIEEQDEIVVGYVPPDAAGSDCGCCEGVDVRTPAPLANRPGQPRIAFRAGTHAAFKSSMLARLSAANLPALAHLRTRSDDDFSIALIDAWAAACDVLTFYQEKIINEAYLATAEERLSIVELARLIGYRPRAGVAAETPVAFTMETAPLPGTDGPRAVRIPRGTRVQSVPGAGETTQTFETAEEITARPEWNALRPKMQEWRLPRAGDRQAFVAGTSTGLKAGDFVLLAGSEGWEFKKLTLVEPDTASNRTRLAWPAPLDWKTASRVPSGETKIFAMRQRAALFGYNAPHPNLLHADIVANYGSSEIAGLTEHREAKEWRFPIHSTGKAIVLDGVYPSIAPRSWIVMTCPTVGCLYRVRAVSEIGLARYAVAGRSTLLLLDSDDQLGSFAAGNYRATAVYAQSERLELAPVPVTRRVRGSSIEIEGRDKGFKGQRIVVRGKRARLRLLADASVYRYSLEANAWEQQPRVVKSGSILTVLLGPLPPVSSGFPPTWLARDDQAVYWLSPRRGRWTLDEPELGAEVATIKSVHDDGTVILERMLGYSYFPNADAIVRYYLSLRLPHPRRDGPKPDDDAVILGNVARATHGETVSEILGSGDASHANQRFLLKQTPLTHIGAPTESGTESSLEIRIGDILWREAPSFYGRGPRERIFATATLDGGETIVAFGDGRAGARVPTGSNNVVARYRKGIGRAGNVGRGSISLLTDGPLGVRSVFNPVPASGGADPETRDEARRAAPVTVRTLGRVVSLTDYEDFARSFAGIAKAHAAWVWSGQRREVLITVAGAGGARFAEDSPQLANLVAALRKSGDPFVPVTVRSYVPSTFDLGLKAKIDPDHLQERVVAGVVAELSRAFGFDMRDFGQPVALSEVAAAVHRVPGVVAVDIDVFRITGTPIRHRPHRPRRMPAVLRPDRPQVARDGSVRAAAVLTLALPLHQLQVMR